MQTTTESPRLLETDEAASFVERFSQIWDAPTPERLNSLLHPQVRLIQPMEPDIVGLEAAADLWRHLFSMMPDVRGEVLSWAQRDGVLFIELSMGGTFAGRRLDWVTVDRIRLDDGRVRERIAYFNPLGAIRAIALRPRGLASWVRHSASRVAHKSAVSR